MSWFALCLHGIDMKLKWRAVYSLHRLTVSERNLWFMSVFLICLIYMRLDFQSIFFGQATISTCAVESVQCAVSLNCFIQC